MPRTTPRELVIDARPRGPRGLLAVEHVRGRSVLGHLLDAATAVGAGAVSVHAPADAHPALGAALGARDRGRYVLDAGPPRPGAVVLTTDRLYDAGKLRRACRRGADAESAVVWRLDGPGGVDAAGDELVRRRTYQPLGRYWALRPARAIARALAPTRVRPNAVTAAAAALMLAGSAAVAFGGGTRAADLGAALAFAAALVLDTADGHLARLQGTASAFGRWLDAWLDEVCDMALHAAVSWSAFDATGSAAWLAAGMVYAMGKYVFVIGTVAGPCEAGGDGDGDGGDAPRVSWARGAVRAAGHADVRWHLWIVLAAGGRLDVALAAYAAYFPARALLSAAGRACRHA